MEVVIGVVCLIVGAAVVYVVLAGKSTSRLKAAESQLETAKAEASRITTLKVR